MGDDPGVVRRRYDHHPDDVTSVARPHQRSMPGIAGVVPRPTHRVVIRDPPDARRVVIRGPPDPRRVVIRRPPDPRRVVDHPPHDHPAAMPIPAAPDPPLSHYFTSHKSDAPSASACGAL
jgi:hypothetical protein